MSTKSALTCSLEPDASVMPPATPGVTGYCDAADPEAEMSYAGDTPGPVGTGGDAAAGLVCAEPTDPGVLLCVDERRVMGVFRKHAYVTAELKYASRSGRDVNLGERRVVEAEQDKVLAETLKNYAQARQQGGDALLEYLDRIANEANRRQSDLRELFGAAVQAAERDVAMWGYAGMVVATINLGATLTRKIVSDLTGPVGWGIDVTTDVAVAGIDALYDSKDKDEYRAVRAEIETLAKELGKKGASEFDEIVEELYKLQGGGVTEEYVEQLIKRVEALEARMAAQMKAYPTRYANHGSYRRALKGFQELKPLLMRYKAVMLPLRGARWLARKGGTKMVGAVFLAADIKEATDKWYSQMQQFSSN